MNYAAVVIDRYYYEITDKIIKIDLVNKVTEEFPLPLKDLRPKAYYFSGIMFLVCDEKIYGLDILEMEMFELCPFVRCSRLF